MTRTLTAFAGDLWIATGDEAEIRAALLAMGDDAQAVLLFDDTSGRQVDIDLRATAEQQPRPRGRGRPSLGVKPREVTLLPRHWDWLAAQPGGASATLRKLVEQARKTADTSPRAAKDATYQFLTVMAGDRPGYEEVIRALYAGDEKLYTSLQQDWPVGIRSHAAALAAGAFPQTA